MSFWGRVRGLFFAELDTSAPPEVVVGDQPAVFRYCGKCGRRLCWRVISVGWDRTTGAEHLQRVWQCRAIDDHDFARFESVDWQDHDRFTADGAPWRPQRWIAPQP